MYNTYDVIAYQDELISIKQIEPLEWTNNAFEFTIIHESEVLKQPVWFSHLSLLALLKTDFETVLDIGSGDGMASWIFKFLGKKVISVEPFPIVPHLESIDIYTPDYTNDYMEVNLSTKVDAIWCSHVLEHVRNSGNFLDKIYNDLKDGGILALTVPFNDMTDDLLWHCFGHYNKYTHSLLIYQLVCAGFNCKDIHVANYMGQIGIILKKVPNNLPKIGTGITREDLGQFFPDEMKIKNGDSGTWCNLEYINWSFPITAKTEYDINLLKKNNNG